jgi:hypothetical protein
VGGAYSHGDTLIRNTTIANHSAHRIGGLFVFQGRTALLNSTIPGNVARNSVSGGV